MGVRTFSGGRRGAIAAVGPEDRDAGIKVVEINRAPPRAARRPSRGATPRRVSWRSAEAARARGPAGDLRLRETGVIHRSPPRPRARIHPPFRFVSSGAYDGHRPPPRRHVSVFLAKKGQTLCQHTCWHTPSIATRGPDIFVCI